MFGVGRMFNPTTIVMLVRRVQVTHRCACLLATCTCPCVVAAPRFFDVPHRRRVQTDSAGADVMEDAEVTERATEGATEDAEVSEGATEDAEVTEGAEVEEPRQVRPYVRYVSYPYKT